MAILGRHTSRAGVRQAPPGEARPQCQRVVSEKPAMISAKPISRFQLSSPGMGYDVWEM